MMKRIIMMRNVASCSVFILLIFLTSCAGQEHKSSKEVNTASSNSDNSNSAEHWVDPLFFIDGQLCQHLRKIFQDKSGNLWFGTNVYGLMRYNGDTLEYFTEKDGLGGGRITGIVEDVEGNLWFGTAKGLTKYDGKSFTNFSREGDILNNEIWSVAIDRDGLFWLGTTAGVSRFDGEEFTDFAIPKAQVKDTTTIYSYDRIASIVEDKNGNLWFGTDGFGICKFDGISFTNITTDNGLADNIIHELMEDTKGNIWIGTYFGGVSMYNGESITNFTQDGVVNGVEVGGFHEDNSGNIWFAAENHGVYRYDGESFSNFYKVQGLVTNGILSILEDDEGRFWFGGWGGLFRYDGKFFSPVTKDGPWDEQQ